MAERKILNTDHCMIGKILCDMWNIPDHISSAIFYHRDIMDSPRTTQKITQMVHLADHFCRKALIGNPSDDIIPDPPDAALSLLAITPKRIKTNYDKILAELMEEREDILNYYAGLRKSHS